MFFSPTLFGQSETAGDPLIRAAGASLIFGIIGIVLLIVGYFLFDWLCRRIDIQEQLNKGNMAVAVVVGALLLSIAIIAAHVVS
jgi:putative membrane protein